LSDLNDNLTGIPMRKKLLAAAAATAAAAAATIVLTSQPALAINQYTTTGNVPKPAVCNNHGTMPAGGWLANKACGYVMGTAMAGTKYDVSSTLSNNFHFGRWRAGDGSNFCAWLVPGALDTSHSTSVADSCGTGTSDAMVHRLSFGHDFDAAPHTGDGAIVVPIDPSACTGYYNYFVDSSFQTGRLHDPLGVPLPSAGGYRYSTRDDGASMIRADVGGETQWFFVARSCIQAQLPAQLNNQND
jgi:hypothetical protein